MEINGSKTTFNFENVLRQNVLDSDYFRETCCKLTCWEEIVDEIYINVNHVEPWMSGNARGASTAFCLLYRCFMLKLTKRQIKDLIIHPDSPFIRAIGFLYLRYACDPKDLWSWYEPYVQDEQVFCPSPTGPSITIGEFVIDIMLCQYYFETIFPRIPKKCMDFIISTLKHLKLRIEAKGNAGCGGPDRRGADEPNRRPASVKASLSVAFGQRAPNRSSVREDGTIREKYSNIRKETNGNSIVENERTHTRDSSRGRESERHLERHRSRRSRSTERRRYRDLRDEVRESRKRSSPHHRRDRSRSPVDIRHYRSARRDERSSHHYREEKRNRRSSSDRKRSMSPKEGTGRDVRDVFKEIPPQIKNTRIVY